jgi:prolyl 4-hydroxylase
MTINFINETFLKDLSICDDLINYHKNSENKTQGVIYSSNGGADVNPNIKLSIDVCTRVDDAVKNIIFNRYFKELQTALDLYTKKYSFSNAFSKFSVIENINIQHYKANEGYFAWHCERGNAVMPQASRHLVFMTYLNDVVDAGQTEFYYQNLKVIPQKGKTVIWPADWTHTHRGITSPTQEKYIITGWFNYLPE